MNHLLPPNHCRRAASPLALAALGALGARALACAHAKPKVEVVWPEPPETARIKFVRSIHSSFDLDDSGWGLFLRSVAGGAPEHKLIAPLGLAVSDDGERLYIADNLAAAVFLADFKDHQLRKFTGDFPTGMPFGIALDKDETVYFADAKNLVIRVFSREGRPLRAFGGDLVRPTGIALDRERRLLYVVDSARQKSDKHRVLVFNPDTGKLLRELGPKEGPPGRGPGDGQFYFPTYVTLDAQGNVYVSDTLNFRYQVFSPDGTFLRKFGENGDSPGTFNKLKGLDFDGFGNLYTVDTGQHVVQIFNSRDQLLMGFAGEAPNMLEYLDLPGAIAIDRRHNVIYVANTGFPRVNVYQLVNTKPEDSFEAQQPSATPGAATTPQK